MYMHAAIYCRISEDREGAGLGVERQRQDCGALATARGWEVVGVYTDNDISAYSGKPRPQYRRLLDDIERGAVEALVVWHLDRLHRQPKELESFIDLVERKRVALASVSGEHDLATPEGRLHARILGAVARMESEHKSRRIRRKKIENAERGLPNGGGYRPFGYENDRRTLVPSEAAIVREAARRLLTGETLRSVVLDLNARAVTTTEGRPWIGRSLKRVLLSPRYAGFAAHRDVGRVKAVWPAILSADEQERVAALFSPAHLRVAYPRGRPSKYLLTGLLRCGECGRRMHNLPVRGRRRVYACPPPPNGCARVSLSAAWSEIFVVNAVLEAIGRVESPSRDQDPDVRTHLAALDQDRAQLDELAGAYAARRITMNEWLVARTTIETRIRETQQRLAQDTQETALTDVLRSGGTLRDRWPSLSIDEQRSILIMVLDHIVVLRVGKGVYMDPSRLVPGWRL